MKNLKKFNDYNPDEEYKAESRRSLNLDSIRARKEYKRIIDLGFEEETSHQQEINNTMKFIRTKNKQKEKDHDDVFYTIHPTGTVRRYNPIKAEEIPQGSGNDIKKFIEPFEKPKDYIKGLNYLWQYLKRKEANKDFR
jgi:hypothetical protein